MYKKLGYHLERGLFPKADIVDLRTKMVSVFQTYAKDNQTEFNQLIANIFRDDRDGFIGCANVCQNLIELCRLSVDDRLISTLNRLGLEFPMVNTRPLVSFSSRATASNDNYWRVPAHQDWPSTQGSINGLTCWTPLVDVGDLLGPLEVVPGSHLDGLLDHEDDGVPKLVGETMNFLPIPMEIGDALFFSNFTIHRSGLNQSDLIRWTAHFRYNDVRESTFVERKFPRHRIDKRKEGILYPGFPSKEQINVAFGSREVLPTD